MDLIVVQTRSRADALAALHGFTRSFLLTAMLAVLVVLVTSVAQIRRVVGPVVSLRGATAKIAAGENLPSFGNPDATPPPRAVAFLRVGGKEFRKLPSWESTVPNEAKFLLRLSEGETERLRDGDDLAEVVCRSRQRYVFSFS